MSEENVELTHRALDAFNRRDIDGCLALCDEDVEVFSRLAPLAEGGYQGHDGVRRWFQNLFDAFPDWHSKALEVRGLGDTTIGAVRIRGHGGQSGAPIDQTVWQVAEWRDGKCVRLSSHDSKAEALKAAGLSE